MEITYDYYRIFYHVAKYGGISQAAKVLMRGQPNVSKTVQLLETQLGCKLLVRSNRGVTLTAEGETLYRHLKVAFEHIVAAEEEILTEKKLEGGLVSVSVAEVALYGAILPMLNSFRINHPNVRIKLTNSNNENALRMLENGLSDFAVLTMHEKIDSNFRVRDIRCFREILCAKREYLQSGEQVLDILKNRPYIGLNANTYTHEFCMNYFLSLGINRAPDIEVSTSNQVLQLIKAGIGVGFVSEPLAEEWLENGTLEEICLPTPHPVRKICLVEDRERPLGAAARAFARCLI